MSEIPQPLKALDEQGQVVQFVRRQRTRSFRDVRKGLFRNRLIALDDILPANYFSPDSVRSAAVTFHTRVRILGVAPVGAIFQFGRNTQAIVCWVDAGSVFAGAGAIDAPSDDGVIVEAPFEPVAGNELDVVVACNPGTGVLAVFLDGDMTREQSVNPELLNGEWAQSGGPGEWNTDLSAPPGLVTQIAAPVDFAIVHPLSVYHRQHPRHLLTARV